MSTEARFAILGRTHPERAARLAALVQADVDERWQYYEQLAAMERAIPHEPDPAVQPEVDSDAGYRYDEDERSRMTDLRTTYLGLELRSPIVASAGPLTRDAGDRPAPGGGGRRPRSCCHRCSRRRSSTRRSS